MIDRKQYNTIDEYIAMFPKDVQIKLEQIRTVIKIVVPNATEAISWQMPTFKLSGNLVHFAAFKNHIGLYPGPEAIVAFKDELVKYKTSKGAIQFPLSEAIPLKLIEKIVDYRIKNM